MCWITQIVSNLLVVHYLPTLGALSSHVMAPHITPSELLIHKDVQTIIVITVIPDTQCSCMT